MSHETGARGEHKPHVLPVKVYVAVWGGLLALTVLTVYASYVDFGLMSLIVAVGIATIKATLVVMFFMHLKYDEPFNVIVFASSLAFLGVFFMFTLADTVERGKVDPIEKGVIELVPGRPDLMEAGAHGQEGAGVGTHGAAPGDGSAAPPDASGPAEAGSEDPEPSTPAGGGGH